MKIKEVKKKLAYNKNNISSFQGALEINKPNCGHHKVFLILLDSALLEMTLMKPEVVT